MSKSSELIPNSFQVPNLIVDRLLPLLSGPQTKIALLVCRKTFGWGKRTDLISFGQFETEAGVSRSSVYEALELFVSAGLLLKVSNGVRKVNGWSLNLGADAGSVIEGLKSAAKTAKKPICIAERTSSLSELVQPAIHNCIAQRTRSISPGEPTETQETHKPNAERKGKWESSVEECFGHYREVMGKGRQYELTSHRLQIGVKGLRLAARYAANLDSNDPDGDAMTLLKLAIDRMKCDRWHNGEESGVKYLDWDQLFTSKTYRDRKLTDYWLNEDNLEKWGAA